MKLSLTHPLRNPSAILTALAAFGAILLCMFSGVLLFLVSIPMEDRSFNFSLFWEGEGMPLDWVYDQKGWTVFTQEGDTAVTLQADGIGGFTGLQPGQTFYFSRTLSEEADNPVLHIDAGEYAVAAFLDNFLLYTDCPEQDNRVGALALPILDWYRTEPVTITLPPDYLGKTLTIAQATNALGDDTWRDSFTVYPVAVSLFCGYAFESSLIADCFRAAVPSVLAFSVGILLLIIFLLQVFRDSPEPEPLFGALMAFFWLIARLVGTEIFGPYYNPPFRGLLEFDYSLLPQDLNLLFLFLLMAIRMAGKYRYLLWLFSALQCALITASAILQMMGLMDLPFIYACNDFLMFALLSTLVCSFLEWRRGSRFFALFSGLTCAGILAWFAAVAVSAFSGGVLAQEVWGQFRIFAVGYFQYKLALLMGFCALFVTILRAVYRETSRRTELQLVAQRQSLELHSFENMQRQHEEIMMIRHDMSKHFTLLRQMVHDSKAAAYLDELIGQNEKIRPVIQSGNAILDTVLNSRIGSALDQGIGIEVVRARAPRQFPLSDAELCSLVMNLTDNAIAAAAVSGAERPCIRLDFHVRNNFFVFTCENSATLQRKRPEPGHGLGLKIIRQTVERYDGLLETETDTNTYRITVTFPLSRIQSFR